MAFLVEDGSGVNGANAYMTVAEADTYFTDRGIAGWTGVDTIKQTALIKATDFIEKRFSSRFLGQKQYDPNGAAKNVLTFTAQPTNGTSVSIDGQTFTFGVDVVIGTRLSFTIAELAVAINGNATLEVGAEALPNSRLAATAAFSGPDANSFATTTTVVGASWTNATLTGGNDDNAPQPLSFPRINLYFPGTSTLVVGIPKALKEAVAEYALRALTANLIPDPLRDDTGNEVTSKREKVGPIEEETGYLPGLSQAIPKYPAADRLLSQFTGGGSGSGGVIR